MLQAIPDRFGNVLNEGAWDHDKTHKRQKSAISHRRLHRHWMFKVSPVALRSSSFPALNRFIGVVQGWLPSKDAKNAPTTLTKTELALEMQGFFCETLI